MTPTSTSGNLGQLFNKKGLHYHHNLVAKYGSIVKVYGFFGVYCFLFRCSYIHSSLQDEQLYISDPRALHYILGKDEDAFEETAVFTE